VGVAVGAVILVGGSLWFLLARSSFESAAHYTAAIAFFVCIIIVVHINARDVDQVPAEPLLGALKPRKNFYGAIAAAMLLAPALMLLYWGVFGWDHFVFWLEAVLIVLFAIFWALQTAELWHRGNRMYPADSAPGRQHEPTVTPAE